MCKIFVKRLGKNLTDDMLKNYFSQFAPVKNAYVIFDSKNKRPKGFGYVQFETPSIVPYVLNMSHMIENKAVYVQQFTRADEDAINGSIQNMNADVPLYQNGYYNMNSWDGVVSVDYSNNLSNMYNNNGNYQQKQQQNGNQYAYQQIQQAKRQGSMVYDGYAPNDHNDEIYGSDFHHQQFRDEATNSEYRDLPQETYDYYRNYHQQNQESTY